MKIRHLIVCGSYLWFCSVGVAKEERTETEIVRDAVDSMDGCYHWAEEVGGGGGDERAREIEEGSQRDCPPAKQKAAEVYRRFPKNPQLALGILKMNDIGYLELSEKEKRELCERHVIIAQEEFLKSKRPDGYFQAFCPEQAAEIYGK